MSRVYSGTGNYKDRNDFETNGGVLSGLLRGATVYDQHKKGTDDNPTIGLILCSQKSAALAKYSVLADSEQLFAAKYLAYLPTEAELQQELEREREKVQAQLEKMRGEKDD